MLCRANKKKCEEILYFAIGRGRTNTTSLINSELRFVLK
jgi:hypothetical protein